MRDRHGSTYQQSAGKPRPKRLRGTRNPEAEPRVPVSVAGKAPPAKDDESQ